MTYKVILATGETWMHVCYLPMALAIARRCANEGREVSHVQVVVGE